jgi:hypothetical protein
VQDDSGDPNPTLARQFQAIGDALGEITAAVAVLLMSESKREAPTRELQQILDGVDLITANLWAARLDLLGRVARGGRVVRLARAAPVEPGGAPRI